MILLAFLAQTISPGDTSVSNALILLVVTAIGVLGAIVVLVPPIVKRQVAIVQTAQEEKIKANAAAIEEAQETARQERAGAEEQRKQFAAMIQMSIKRDEANIKRDESTAELQRATVKAFARQLEMAGKQTEITELSRRELSANTKVTTAGVEAISDLSTNIDEMQSASKKATDSIQEAIERMHKEIAEGLIITTDTSQKVNFITTKITEVDTMGITLREILKVTQAQLVMAWHEAGSPPALKPEGANGGVVGLVAAPPTDSSAPQPIMPGDNVVIARAEVAGG